MHLYIRAKLRPSFVQVEIFFSWVSYFSKLGKLKQTTRPKCSGIKHVVNTFHKRTLKDFLLFFAQSNVWQYSQAKNNVPRKHHINRCICPVGICGATCSVPIGQVYHFTALQKYHKQTRYGQQFLSSYLFFAPPSMQFSLPPSILFPPFMQFSRITSIVFHFP